MRKALFIFNLSLLFTLFSCEKDDSEDAIPDPPDPTPAANLFPDGGFEDADLIANWSGILGEYYITDTVSYTGTKSFYVNTSISATSDFEHKLMTIESGVDYELSFWYKLEGTVGAFDNFIVGFKQDGDWPYYVGLDTGWVSTVSYDWTEYIDTIQFVSGSDVEFYLHSNVEENVFDDFVLRKL